MASWRRYLRLAFSVIRKLSFSFGITLPNELERFPRLTKNSYPFTIWFCRRIARVRVTYSIITKRSKLRRLTPALRCRILPKLMKNRLYHPAPLRLHGHSVTCCTVHSWAKFRSLSKLLGLCIQNHDIRLVQIGAYPSPPIDGPTWDTVAGDLRMSLFWKSPRQSTRLQEISKKLETYFQGIWLQETQASRSGRTLLDEWRLWRGVQLAWNIENLALSRFGEIASGDGKRFHTITGSKSV